MDRKAELEKKRRKLEELRKAKELKKQAKEAEKQSHVSQTATEQPDPVDELAKERKDVSLLVDSLIGHEPAAGEVSEKSPEPRSGAVSAEPVETLHSRFGQWCIMMLYMTCFSVCPNCSF
jgi:L-lysine 2,3-aminomutase